MGVLVAFKKILPEYKKGEEKNFATTVEKKNVVCILNVFCDTKENTNK